MELTISELKPLIKYIVNNNERLQKENKDPKAINIVGNAGIAKSASVEQVANELGYNYIKLNLSQITETGDICGFPLCLHYACLPDGSDCKWIAPELIDAYSKAGYRLTGDTKMSYALPEWYHKIDPSKGSILLFDDVTRGLPNILQAIYELIYKQEFWSFKLPPRTTIILTSNPDNADYNVNSVDEAFSSRIINFNVKFDIDSWASWAEHNGVDNRAINFLLLHHSELMDDKGAHSRILNARNYTMFADTISGLDNWETPENLAMILQIASGCFNDPDNIVGGLFTNFIANKLDKLIAPEDILLQDWKTLKHRMKECVYNDKEYRADIASVLHTRLINYIQKYFNNKGKTEVVEKRLLEFIDETKDKNNMLFSTDLIFSIIKALLKSNPERCNQFMLNAKFREMIR